MSTRFEPAARKAIDSAMAEVERRGHAALDTLHLLVGLLERREGAIAAAATTTPGLGPRIEALRQAAASALHQRGRDGAGEALEVDSAIEEVLERASRVAAERGGSAVSDLDILVACAERGSSGAGALIRQAGLSVDELRAAASSPEPGAGTPPPGHAAHSQLVAPPAQGSAPAPRSGAASPLSAPPPLPRTGMGYDSHRFGHGGPMRLGGIDIPADVHLVGHSDGDAVAHAVTDAVLGAVAAGDIGEMFSDRDPENRGRDSIEMLRAAVRRVATLGWGVVSVDVTVIAEWPKVGPHRQEMRARLAAALDVGIDAVSVKGKTNESMGWIGRGEGLACIAVATLAPRAPGR